MGRTASAKEYVNLNREIVFKESGSWTCPENMFAIVRCVGGGGSGGANKTNVNYPRATGGGAGEHSIRKIKLTKNTTYTHTIGAGGAFANSVGSLANGNSGGNTSFSGAGIIATTANGGQGGIAEIVNNALSAGGTGGTGGNGDYTFQGGDGGSTFSTSINPCAGGGGAIGLISQGQAGGGNLATSASSTAFGGAGTGGTSSYKPNYSHGGGASGDSTTTYGGAGTHESQRSINSDDVKTSGKFFEFYASGGIGEVNTDRRSLNLGAGAGSGGAFASGAVNVNAARGGIGAGGGGGYTSNASYPVKAGSGGLGGGGGGAVGDSTCTSGGGGDGFIVLELLMEI